ncbi:MAG: hypothetical protein AABX28_00930 [Nanoarchaeota archaeon]
MNVKSLDRLADIGFWGTLAGFTVGTIGGFYNEGGFSLHLPNIKEHYELMVNGLKAYQITNLIGSDLVVFAGFPNLVSIIGRMYNRDKERKLSPYYGSVNSVGSKS